MPEFLPGRIEPLPRYGEEPAPTPAEERHPKRKPKEPEPPQSAVLVDEGEEHDFDVLA